MNQEADMLETLYRIDERTMNLSKDFTGLKEDFTGLKETVENGYLQRAEFEPVKKLVYGLVTMILSTVMLALLALVVREAGPFR